MSVLVSLATSIAGLIAPYLVEGGKKFAAKAGEAAWEKAQEIWTVIFPAVESDRKLGPATELLAADKNSKPIREVFEKALLEYLEANPDTADKLTAILGGPQRVQEIAAEQGGLIEGASQEMDESGEQRIRAIGGTVKDVKQKM
ncbi:hemophore-related protein [Rhizobium puerariae]|uniref:Hemophore-related protein n=1 Tax=Rhizobium puerariae TaxID=1585791 RepID=A0ABV6AFF4_9HYPH